MLSTALSFIRKTLHHQGELKRFRGLDIRKRDIVFYAETAAYWAYLGPFVEHLTGKLGRTVCYVTSDDDDPILSDPPDGVEAFAIGAGTVRTLFFATLEARLMVMSLLDLETFNIKKSKAAVVHYVYVPHNMISTHMVFRKGAHNHFDTIFCVGPHQVAELREAERLYGLAVRNLVKNGYVRLDTIHRQAAAYPELPPGEALNILIAPSWGPQGLLEAGAEGLVKNLLDASYKVIIRPHGETIRRAGDRVAALERDFADNDRFQMILDGSTNRLLMEAHLLVSDWSGAAFSFAFGVERPVLFIDTPKKINNPDYTKFTSRPIEITLRDQLGAILPPKDFDKAARLARELCSDPEGYRKKVRDIRSRWIFNLGDSAAKGARVLADLADGKKI